MSLMFLIQVELCIIHFIMCPIVLFSAEELGILKHVDLRVSEKWLWAYPAERPEVELMSGIALFPYISFILR